MDSNYYENIELEFLELSHKCSSLPNEETKAEWKEKNRYSNNQPYENYRIKLRNAPCDYINASNWKLPELNSNFIATQAPLKETTNDFWNMVHQENCSIIISLLKNDKKHHKYWIGDDIEYQKEIINDDVVLRKIQHKSKTVYQLQYLGWPDHGVPNDLDSFAKFILKCEELIKLVQGGIVVHCSAGMGRTGTLVSILARRFSQDRLDIPKIVFELRKRRHKYLVVETKVT